MPKKKSGKKMASVASKKKTSGSKKKSKAGSRRRSTARKAAPAKKAANGAARGQRRKPEWKLVTYDELDQWRQSQGLAKKRVAQMIGVTNSTYHNWARGIAVATPNTQRKIRQLIDGGPATLPADNGAAKSGAHPRVGESDALSVTAEIINTYQQTNPGQLSPERLTQLVREVRQALGG